MWLFIMILMLSLLCDGGPPSVDRRVKEAVRDRDVRLGDLQSKIEQLSRAKERATEDSGSEVASLELKLATAIKDNSELLKANKWVRLRSPALFISS